MQTMKASQFASFCMMCLLGLNLGAAYAQPYTVSNDGTEVNDLATGLTWRRCAEGMQGSTCAGTASTYTHEAALQQAASVSTPTLAWRLPNVKELASIADDNIGNPAIDSSVFPTTPFDKPFWSSTPYVGDPAIAMVVYFSYGHTYSGLRSSSNYVRLVRTGQ